MGAYLPDDKDLLGEQDLLNNAVYQMERGALVEFLARLHALRSHGAFVELHKELLRHLRARQILIGELRERQQERRETVAELAAQRPKPVALLRREDEHIKGEKALERVLLALQSLVRSIADGLAWYALEYDRRAVQVIGRGDRVAWLSDGPGLRAEIGVLQDAWERDLFAVLNDSTNCLRHGDVTAVSRAARTIELYEVKAGDGANAGQSKRMEEVASVLNSGWHPTAGGGKPLQLVRVSQAYQTDLGILPELFRRARDVGLAWAQTHSSVVVRVFDVSWAGNREALTGAEDEIRQAVSWYHTDGGTIEFLSAIRRMRDRRHSFSVLAPFSIFPVPVEDIADLMLGNMELATIIHGPTLEAAFADAGMSARVELGDDRFDSFVVVERNGEIIEIPATVREQMFLELLTPAAVIAAADELLMDMAQHPSAAENARMVTFASESAVWSPPL